jgi:hypothetical protein
MYGNIRTANQVRDEVSHYMCESYEDILSLPTAVDAPFGSDCYVLDEEKTLYMTTQWELTKTTVAMPLPSIYPSAILSGTEITLTCATAGASVYYTTDGSVPDATDTAYTVPIAISADTTLKAIAIKDAASSLIMTAVYTIPKAITPLILPLAGEYLIGQELTMTCPQTGATIYYTTNGSTPTAGSTAYNPLSKPTLAAGGTIKAVAIVAGYANSNVYSVAYTISIAATPVATPVAGAVADNSEVVLTCATEEATIYYTVDNSTPDATKTEYTEPIVITDAVTIKAIAIHANYTNSAVLIAAYTIV